MLPTLLLYFCTTTSKMGVDMQAKLKLALGSVKDQASIGKAMMLHSMSDIEIAVIRATGHGSSPVEDKHLHEILFLVSDTQSSVSFLADRVSRRLEKTKDITVALKTLLLVHRLLRGGTRLFEQQLCRTFFSGHLQLWCPLRYPRFLQSYTGYLEERMSWVMNPSGKLEPADVTFREDFLFRRISKCQILVDKVLALSPPNSSELVHAAMANTLKESFQVHEMVSEHLSSLMDMILDMAIPVTSFACEVLKKASRQSERLSGFYEECKVLMGTKKLEYPSVQLINIGHVEALEQCSVPVVEDQNKTKKHAVVLSPVEDETFSRRLETKISDVWVVFDEEEFTS